MEGCPTISPNLRIRAFIRPNRTTLVPRAKSQAVRQAQAPSLSRGAKWALPRQCVWQRRLAADHSRPEPAAPQRFAHHIAKPEYPTKSDQNENRLNIEDGASARPPNNPRESHPAARPPTNPRESHPLLAPPPTPTSPCRHRPALPSSDLYPTKSDHFRAKSPSAKPFDKLRPRACRGVPSGRYRASATRPPGSPLSGRGSWRSGRRQPRSPIGVLGMDCMDFMDLMDFMHERSDQIGLADRQIPNS